jgi:acyl-CoA thioesterase
MNETLALKVVDKMLENDLFSQWLGIKIEEVTEGSCVLSLAVRKEMLNGFSILHGGVTFSLADTALAFAANTHGKKCVSLETSMSYIEKVSEGDILMAKASEASINEKTGIYYITITNQDNKKIALFKGTVWRTSKDWF